ncbi:hypothetical protein AURDEDRAFT_115875 [Auricularia subglabra TFB-10046 SS5]|nr:hypothetical protein AURDEDRAFT_115875 [Auricularia subglabra TFB-10046 SS5]
MPLRSAPASFLQWPCLLAAGAMSSASWLMISQGRHEPHTLLHKDITLAHQAPDAPLTMAGRTRWTPSQVRRDSGTTPARARSSSGRELAGAHI